MLTQSDLVAIKSLVKEEITALKKRIDTFEDKMIGRLDNIDQELALTNGYGDKLENHEERITKLENVSTTTKI